MRNVVSERDQRYTALLGQRLDQWLDIVEYRPTSVMDDTNDVDFRRQDSSVKLGQRRCTYTSALLLD